MTNYDVPKTYDPAATEKRLYQWWEKSGFFTPPINWDRQPFVISMPPSNITGELHIGHALVMSIQDMMIRWHRMKGEPTLWLPGNDHASIGTHNVIEKALAQRTCDDLLASIGYPVPEDNRPLARQDLGRDWFVRLGWAWKDRYGNAINEQLRRLGTSCDWARERFTMDDMLSRAVRESFVQLYRKGLIYRGNYMVNWCPRCQTAISDLEVIHEEMAGKLYYVRYWLTGGGDDYVVVATTRPETILGDTAVAVHPDDERYRDLVGRYAILPGVKRAVPIITDRSVDPGFGTGAVKVTPGHDPTDYDVGQRHGLPTVNIMNPDGTLNENAGPYQGLDRYQGRRKLLADLETTGDLIKVEDHYHALGHCQRCDTVIEPLVSEQWFVKVRPLAERAIEVVHEGRIRFIPERFAKIYFNWMENIHDWCISRQLYWGHRIPVWYCDDCGEVIVASEDPTWCQACGSDSIRQDPDILDTWYSSALWPFSTLGWPDDTEDLRYFYPTTVMETGHDIIFFWVARMIMMGLECVGDIPFHIVYLHGMVRDEFGQKMSRSKGNVIDPLEVIAEYGCDALRFTLLTGSTPGNEVNLSLQRVKGNRNFANKLWNAARFVLSQMTNDQIPNPNRSLDIGHWSLPDRWILSRHNRLISNVTRLMEEWNFGEAGRQIYEFLWGEFCDWYLEISKIALYGDDQEVAARARAVLLQVLERTLRLLHPFMPFVTEEIWQHLKGQGTRDKGQGEKWPEALIIAPWPEAGPTDEVAEQDMALVMNLVRAIRNARAEYEVDPGRRIAAIISANGRRPLIEAQASVIASLARLESTRLQIEERLAEPPARAVTLVIGEGVEVYLPLAGMVDLDRERERLSGELERLVGDIARVEGLLARQGFLAKAPAEVVEREQARLAGYREKEAKVRARLEALA